MKENFASASTDLLSVSLTNNLDITTMRFSANNPPAGTAKYIVWCRISNSEAKDDERPSSNFYVTSAIDCSKTSYFTANSLSLDHTYGYNTGLAEVTITHASLFTSSQSSCKLNSCTALQSDGSAIPSWLSIAYDSGDEDTQFKLKANTSAT